MEGTIVAPEVKVETPVTPEVKPVVKEDLMTRVANFKTEAKLPEVNVEEPKFDINDIDKIADPVAKEQAMRAYKSFQRGFNQKFQELAETRKALEAKAQASTTWTPERIKQELLNNPDFIQASQKVLQDQPPANSNMNETEWSSLTDSEKKQWSNMQAELQSLKQKQHNDEILKNFRMQDETIKTKFPDYDPNAVDIITDELLTGKRNATREDIWKVYKHDENVQRAYELGKMDALQEKHEKTNGSSFEGLSTRVSNGEKLEPIKGESDRSFFTRLVESNIQKMKQIR
jgi:hypothetical protein